MNIGIVTLPLRTNYGGLLQAYALQKVLLRMGHTPVTFTRVAHESLDWKTPVRWAKRFLCNPFRDKKTPVFYELIFNRTYSTVSQHTQGFIDRNITTRVIRSWNEMKESDYDLLIVGSDQVWRPMYFSPIEHAFLDFAAKWEIKRLAYASSFGTDEWEYNVDQTKRCRSLVRLFDGISVREVSGIKLCQEFLDCSAVSVLDPTMLLTPEDYIALFEEQKIPAFAGNLLVYILDMTDEKSRLIDYLSEKYVPFVVNSRVDDLNRPTVERIQPPVEAWLRGFYDAEIVVTDSFHACVFAILFHKTFIVYGNEGRGMARFYALLALFGLESQLVRTSEDVIKALSVHIDWGAVDVRLQTLREQSISFLKKYIC